MGNNKESIWQALFRWDTLGVVLPAVPLALGFAMLGIDWFPHNLAISQICFALTGLLLVVKLMDMLFSTMTVKSSAPFSQSYFL